MSCLALRHFRKIKQVSSTKLTNWYKTFVVENKNLHRLILLGANPKSQKYCYQIFGSIRQKWNKSITTRLSQKNSTIQKNRSSKTWNLDFFLRYQKRFWVYIKYIKVNKWYCLTHYQDDQILTSRLWAYLHIESVTWLNTIVKNLRQFWYFKKRSAEFQPSQWNSTKNQNSNLFVCSQKFLQTHKPKKREVPKLVLRLFHVLT